MWYKSLTLSRRRPLSYRNQSTDLLRKSMDRFLMITASVLKGLIEMEIQWKSLVEKVQWKSSLLSNLFLLRIRDRGYCPVINLKELNQNIPHQHFKMEGLHYLKFMLRQGDYMWKPDLHGHLLFDSIEWKLQENGTLSMVREFAWVSLNLAKLLLTLILLMLNIRIIYLDDILIFETSTEEILIAIDTSTCCSILISIWKNQCWHQLRK